jgi:hypothetical protein
VRRDASAGYAGSSEGSAGSRGLLLLAAVALATLLLALTAGPASADPPVVTMGSISNVQGASAHATGTVNPGGQFTYWSFEYSTDEVNWSGFAFQGAVEGSGAQPVEADIGGLQASTKYFVRIAATNFADPTAYSQAPYAEFTTLPVATPNVLEVKSSELAYTTAKASGEIERETSSDPAFNVNCRFETVTDAQFTANGFTDARQFECAPNPLTEGGATAVTANLTELSPGTKYHLRLTGSNAGGSDSLEGSTFTTLTVTPPTVLSVETTTAPTNSAVKVAGEVERPASADPAFDSSCNFEYVTEAQFVTTGFANASQVGCSTNPITAAGVTPVTAQLTGLSANTTYYLRLTATNLGGPDSLDAANFETTAVIKAQTLSAGALGSDSATLAGRINPANAPVTYQFEWGTSNAYGNFAPADPEPLAAANENFNVVTVPLTGLEPETTYHFQLVATNTETNQVVEGGDRTFTTAADAGPSGPCPNETSRTGFSANLPDCRAYEFVTPGLNSAAMSPRQGLAQPDGSKILFRTIDAPDDAESSLTVNNYAVAERGPDGWNVKSVTPPSPAAASTFFSSAALGMSNDFTKSFVGTPQPLTDSEGPVGIDLFMHTLGGDSVRLTKVPIEPFPPPFTVYSNKDFAPQSSRNDKHVFFQPSLKQLPEDPIDGNWYEWTEGTLRLVGILPNGTPAPNGATIVAFGLPSLSDDGTLIAFSEISNSGSYYLRINGEETVEVSESQRTVDPDPEPHAAIDPMGITRDGSQVLFISKSQLTNDAFTGETEGAPNHKGGDLYSYDVQSGMLTDLTADASPEDEETGANVRAVVGASHDGSYIYFVATGKLADGAVSGERNLYVEHNGEITFIAPGADAIFEEEGVGKSGGAVVVTSDGLHALIGSRQSLTGYNNTSTSTGEPAGMIYRYTYGGSLECVSCRPDGSQPSGDSGLGENFGFGTLLPHHPISEDGSRIFFQSADPILPESPVLPESTDGVQSIYEWTKGEIHLISPSDAEYPSTLLDASASGDDVFFITYDELTPDGDGPVQAIYDARVNADTYKAPPLVCQGESCRGSGTVAPAVESPASAQFKAAGRIGGPQSAAARGAKLKLRLIAPGAGQLSISGKGLKPAKQQIAKDGPVTVTVVLKPQANTTRRKKGVFRTKAEILFQSSSGDTSRGEASLKFEGPRKKGRK